MPTRRKLLSVATFTLLLTASSLVLPAQMGPMPATAKAPVTPSIRLTVTGLTGKVKVLTPADMLLLPHVTVHVKNAHNNNQEETYSGVPIKDLLALVEPGKNDPPAPGPKASANMTVVIGEATDNFRVALTLCDTNPDCRNGQAIVADALNGGTLGADGAFKLILTEDKKPSRWARNLNALAVKSLASF